MLPTQSKSLQRRCLDYKINITISVADIVKRLCTIFNVLFLLYILFKTSSYIMYSTKTVNEGTSHYMLPLSSPFIYDIDDKTLTKYPHITQITNMANFILTNTEYVDYFALYQRQNTSKIFNTHLNNNPEEVTVKEIVAAFSKKRNYKFKVEPIDSGFGICNYKLDPDAGKLVIDYIALDTNLVQLFEDFIQHFGIAQIIGGDEYDKANNDIQVLSVFMAMILAHESLHTAFRIEYNTLDTDVFDVVNHSSRVSSSPIYSNSLISNHDEVYFAQSHILNVDSILPSNETCYHLFYNRKFNQIMARCGNPDQPYLKFISNQWANNIYANWKNNKPFLFENYKQRMYQNKTVKSEALDAVISKSMIITLDKLCQDLGIDSVNLECPETANELFSHRCADIVECTI